MAREAKKLEPMNVDGQITFRNYFQFKRGTFHIDLSIHVPDHPDEIKAELNYRNQ